MNEESQSHESPDLHQQAQAIKDLIDEGNYDAALTRVRSLLDDYPDQAEAYTLLGDVYAARNIWPEAVDWYHEGAERGDSSAADKLREARTQLNRQLEQPGQPHRTLSASEAEQQNTKLWITLASAGAIVVIAGVIAALTFLGGPSSSSIQSPAQPLSEPGSAGPGTRSPHAIAHSTTRTSQYAGSRSAVSTSRLPTGSGTEPTAPSQVAGGPPSAISQEEDKSTITVVKGPRTERDMILESALGSLTWPDGSAMRNDVSVATDPFLGYAMITFEIPGNLASNNLSATVIKQAYSVATTAINTDQGLKAMTLRAIVDSSSSQRRKRGVVAYRGNTTRASLQYWLRHGRSPSERQLWNEVFATTWWNPTVPSQ